jgi:hypothetical protein
MSEFTTVMRRFGLSEPPQRCITVFRKHSSNGKLRVDHFVNQLLLES